MSEEIAHPDLSEEDSGGVEDVSGRLRPQADLFVGLGIMAFGAFVAFESWRMPRFEHLAAQHYEVPGLVPGLLGLIILGFGLLMFIRAVREGGLQLGAQPQRLRALLNGVEPRRVAWLLLFTIAYAGVLIGRVPFWLATLLFVLAFILFFDAAQATTRNQRLRLCLTASVQAVLTALIVTYVFEYVFRVRLP